MQLRVAYALLWAVLALRAGATLFPSSWLWGLDSLADRGPALKAIGLLLFAASAIPAVGRALLRPLSPPPARAATMLSAGAGIGIFLGVLILLRSGNPLLGDAQTYLSAIDKGVRSAGAAHREPLSQAVVIGFHRLVSAPLGWSSHASFVVLEAALGVGFLLLAHRLSVALADSPAARALAFGVIALGGGLHLFAGYPEFYGFGLTAFLLFAWLGARSLAGDSPVALAALAFVLAALCHAQALFAAPAIGYLLIKGWLDGRRRDALLGIVSIPAVGLLALILLRYPFGDLAGEAAREGAFLPPLGRWTARTAYGLYSPVHLADLANALLLAAPGLPVALALAWRAKAGTDAIARRRAVFLACLAAGPALFALVANPQLGMARDWDIFVLPAVAIAIWSAAVAAGGFARPSPGHRGLAGVLLLTGLLHSFFWIDANHRPAPSHERMSRVARNQALFGKRSLAETWRYIGSTEMAAGREGEAAASYLRAIRSDPDERMNYRFLASIRVARSVREGGSVEAGLAAYHGELSEGESRPAYAHLGGVIAALAARRLDLAMAEGDEMIAAAAEHAELVATWGDLRRMAGQTDEAEEAYRRALGRDPALPRALIGMACLAGMRGDRAMAEDLAREAGRRTPWSPQAQQFARQLAAGRFARPDQFGGYFYFQ